MKKPIGPTARQKIKVGQKLRMFAENTHWSEPPGEERDGQRTISLKEFTRELVNLQRQKQETIGKDVDPLRIIDALRSNDVEPFFQALRYDPTVLLNPHIYRQTLGAWFQRKFADEEARESLKRIGAELAFKVQGTKSKQNPRPNREAKSISAGAARLERQYSKWFEFYKKSEPALRQTLGSYRETARVPETKREQIIDRFKERIKREG